ncbi:uncharacterized protein [Antedon mediterranea]|uniref:uncharacterized protein n=1 Tax=Antedon mediterranea TaxID=105859 RepID=UPI003AF9D262
MSIKGYNWVGKERNGKKGGGIGLFLSDKIVVTSENILNCIDDDFERLWVKVSVDKVPLYICVAYFPVQGVNNDLTDDLYAQLLSEIIRIEEKEMNPLILLLDDFNARIGDSIYNGDPVINSNGERLIQFAKNANLTNLNSTIFCEGKITWQRNNQQSTIDYMLYSKSLVNYVNKLIIDEHRQFSFGSDHCVLWLTLNNLNISNQQTSNQNIPIWDIKHNQDYSFYQQKVEEKFNDWNVSNETNINTTWDFWKKTIIEAATEGIGIRHVNNKNKPWFDKEIDDAIKKRKIASREHRTWVKNNKITNRNCTYNNNKNNTMNYDNGVTLWEHYKETQKHVKQLVAQKTSEKRVSKSIEIANKGGKSCKDFWKVLKGNTNNSKNIQCIKSRDSGENIAEKEKMNEVVNDYWENLGKTNMNLNDCGTYLTSRFVNNIRNQTKTNCTYAKDVDENCLYDVKIDYDIVKEAILMAKNNRSPGLDNITNESIKNGGDKLIRPIFTNFKTRTNTKRVEY